MADDTFEPLDLAVMDEYQAQLVKVLSQPNASSAAREADIALAVELYLVANSTKTGYTLDDFRPYQQQFQDIITRDLPEDAASVATALDLLLNGNAQHSPDIPSKTSGVVAEPVHLGTGQFIHAVTDFVVAGAGIDLVFSRTYKSSAFYFGPLGASWDHACNLWLRDNGTSVTVTTGALLPIRYTLHQSHHFYVALGDDSIVVATLDGTFEQRAPDGRIVRFEKKRDADGTIYRVVQISDRFGNFLAFSYDDQNRLSTVAVNHPKRIVAFTYDDQSRIQNITLFPATYTTETGPALIQRTWTYTYDDFSDLVAVTGPSTDEFPSGRTTQYAYSSPSSFAQRQHDMLSITDANGATFLENEYGNAPGTVAFGKVVRQRLGSGVFLFEYAQIIPDLGWTFPDEQRPTSCVMVVQRDGHPVRYVLNAMGNILASEETIVGAGKQTVVWRYAYDADGRRTATVSPEGRVTQIYYGREDFYRRQGSPVSPLPMWQDQNLSAVEHARFGNVIATVQRSATSTLTGLLDDLAIYGDVFPSVIDVDPLNDIIIKCSYENTFQQLATSSDPRYTSSPDPAAAESSAYSKHLTVMTFCTVNGIVDAAPAAITYPDTTYPAPLPSGSTGVPGAQKTFDSYDSNGRLLQWTDPVGNIVANEYFPTSPGHPVTIQGFLASTTVGVGILDLQTKFSVNEAGQVVAVTDPLQNTTQFAIDAFSLMRRVTPPIAGYDISCTYDGNAQVVSRTTAIIDPDGSVAPGSPEVVTFEYNEEMSVVLATIGDKSTTPPRKTRRVYDPSNRLIRLVKPRSNSVCYEYDERSLLKRATSACCEPEAATTAFSHDLDEIVVRVTNPRGFVATTTLDAFARPIRITDPLGNIQRIDYDKLNNPVVRRWFGALINGNYPLLRRAEYVYDERGHLIRERKAFFTLPIPTADPWGHPDAEFNAAVQSGQVQWNDTLTFYDANERIFRIVDPNGHATTMEYDAADRLVATTDPTGNVTRSTYDAGSNIVRVDRYLVDASGNTQAVLSTVYEFDPLNRLRATTDGAGNRITRKFDSRGLLRTVTDALGHVRKYGYNGFRDRVTAIEVLLPTSAGGTTTELTTTTSFDPNSNVVGITDPNGNVTRFEYDPLDRPRLVVNPDGTSRTMRYDPCSNLTDTVDEETLHVTRTYDGLDRLTGIAIQQPQGPASAEQSAQFAYDGVGMLIGHANSFLNVTRSYDSLGRCYQETLTYGPPLDVFTSPLTLLRQFDAASNRIGLGYPSGQTLRYDFGSDNRFMQLRSIANAVAYPGDPGAPANRSILQKQRWGDLTISSQFGNGVTIASAYDAAGRRIADACSLPTGQNFTLQQLWDGAGNRALTIESQSGAVQGWRHEYDSTDRLISSLNLPRAQEVSVVPLAAPTTPLPVTSWNCQQAIDAILNGYGLPGLPDRVYDATGNRVSQRASGGTVAYSTNVRNEYTSVAGASYDYDRAGRLVNNTMFTFDYNYRGQLVQAIAQPSGTIVLQVFHDATGRPIGITEGVHSRVLVLDGTNLLESYDNGVLSAVFMWESQDRLCFVATVAKDQYVMRDVLGSTRLTMDSLGAIIDNCRFDDFGNLIAGAPVIPILYGGKYLYEPICWYEYRARQYVPNLGRFAQPDPAGFVDGANLYSYVANNPLSAVDLSGMDRTSVGRAADTTTRNEQGVASQPESQTIRAACSHCTLFPVYEAQPLDPSYSGPTMSAGDPTQPVGWYHVPEQAPALPNPAQEIFGPVRGDLFNETIRPFVTSSIQIAAILKAPRVAAIFSMIGLARGFEALHQGEYREAAKEFLWTLVELLLHKRLETHETGYSNAEVRQWYVEGHHEIKAAFEPGGAFRYLPLREQSLLANTMRRSLAGEARGMMQSAEEVAALVARDVAKYGPGGRTFANLYRRYSIGSGSEFFTEYQNANWSYRKIIEGASRSNAGVNAQFGIFTSH